MSHRLLGGAADVPNTQIVSYNGKRGSLQAWLDHPFAHPVCSRVPSVLCPRSAYTLTAAVLQRFVPESLDMSDLGPAGIAVDEVHKVCCVLVCMHAPRGGSSSILHRPSRAGAASREGSRWGAGRGARHSPLQHRQARGQSPPRPARWPRTRPWTRRTGGQACADRSRPLPARGEPPRGPQSSLASFARAMHRNSQQNQK